MAEGGGWRGKAEMVIAIVLFLVLLAFVVLIFGSELWGAYRPAPRP